jgi:hypothetical protein
MATSGNRGGPVRPRSALVQAIVAGLREGDFDPEHAGELFLRADAERAIRQQVGDRASITVAGKDEGRLRPVSFMGARFATDLVVEAAGGERVAVTLTLFRGDGAPVAHVLANALVLAGRYTAVVAFVLDRRLGKRHPFADPDEAPEARGLSEAERGFLEQLWEQHRVHVQVRQQNPFG